MQTSAHRTSSEAGSVVGKGGAVRARGSESAGIPWRAGMPSR